MKLRKQRGFVLVLIITLLALIGAEMYVLAAGSNVILSQANEAYLDACERNLVESGLAWAGSTLEAGQEKIPGRMTDLDIMHMEIDLRQGRLGVTLERTDGEVVIEALAVRGRGRHSCERRYPAKL